MATLNVLYDFASNAQGFTANPAASAVLSWSASDSGSLQSSVTGKNHSAQASSWTLTTTWEGLSVPAGATITGVTAASMQSQCTAFTTGGTSHTSGAATLADGATTVTLSAQRSFTATDASPVITNGTDATGLSLAAANSITLTIPNVLSTGNSSSAAMTLLQDELAFTITYSSSVNAVLNATLGAATSASAGAVTVSGALSRSLDTATIAVLATITVAAALDRTFSGATSSAAGTVIVAAAVTRTLGPVTLAASGTTGAAINAALTATLATLEAAASGTTHAITPIGVGTATLYARQTTAGSGIDTLVDPGDSNPPVIFEPPAALSGGDLEIWLIASGGANWGGCQIWVSSDGSTYAMAGTLYRGGRQGLLTATLPSHADPDSTDTLSVDLSESQGQMLSGTVADADNFVTLCYCDGELVSYQTATLTAPYTYDLTYLRRGVYGTPIGAHTSGASFARFGPNDPSLFRYRYPASFAGQTISVKLPAFNIFGQALQDLSGLTPTSYTLTGAGAVPAPAYVSGSWIGSPGVSQVIERYIFATPVTLPAGLAGSYGTAGTAATAAASFSVAKNGTGVGTMDFAASATSATFSMAAATDFGGGDVLTIVAPASPDATLANLAWTLTGTL
jgi:hypothetical protein